MQAKLFPAVGRVHQPTLCRRCGRPTERCRCTRLADLLVLGVVGLALLYGWVQVFAAFIRWVG